MIDEKILAVLREARGAHVSSEDLKGKSGLSRAAIWKHVEKLREEGYHIEATPHLGYRLVGIPDTLIPAEIQWKLATKFVGKKIISYRKVDSTNDVAYALAEQGMAEGTVVFSDEQAKGKGRHGRTWSSPAGSGVYLSCVLRPKLAPNEIPRITLLAAVAVAFAVRDFSGLAASIKWPNDILIEGRKVCGILTEMKAEQDSVAFVIVGIGINVNTKRGHLPKGATSLLEELGGSQENALSRTAFAKALLERIEREYNLMLRDGFKPIIDEWKRLSAMIGSRVKVNLLDRQIEGQVFDIDQDGSLMLRTASGLIEKISSGDVTMIR